MRAFFVVFMHFKGKRICLKPAMHEKVLGTLPRIGSNASFALKRGARCSKIRRNLARQTQALNAIDLRKRFRVDSLSCLNEFAWRLLPSQFLTVPKNLSGISGSNHEASKELRRRFQELVIFDLHFESALLRLAFQVLKPSRANLLSRLKFRRFLQFLDNFGEVRIDANRAAPD